MKKHKIELIELKEAAKEMTKACHRDPVSQLTRLAAEIKANRNESAKIISEQSQNIFEAHRILMQESDNFEEEILEWLCDADNNTAMTIREVVPVEIMTRLRYRLDNREHYQVDGVQVNTVFNSLETT